MYKSSGVVVLDRYPLRKADSEFLDSLLNSMEEGFLYVVITQGKNDYSSPFSYEQVEGWVSNIINGPHIVFVDLPEIKDINNKSAIVLSLCNTLSNLPKLPHIEPLNELDCFISSLKETNPYVNKVQECFLNCHNINIEGLNVQYSRKELFDKLMLMNINEMEDEFVELTPKSYYSLCNYKRFLNTNN